MEFFSPTNRLKELILLQHIEEKPDTTQKEIARAIEDVGEVGETILGIIKNRKDKPLRVVDLIDDYK